MKKKSISFTVSKSKRNITGRVDPILIKYIEAICDVDGKSKTELFEEALWNYVEEKGFDKIKDEKEISITREVPEKYIKSIIS